MILHSTEQKLNKYKFCNFTQNYFKIFAVRFEQKVFSICVVTYACTYNTRKSDEYCHEIIFILQAYTAMYLYMH